VELISSQLSWLSSIQKVYDYTVLLPRRKAVEAGRKTPVGTLKFLLEKYPS
jgi:hypothetical protein